VRRADEGIGPYMIREKGETEMEQQNIRIENPWYQMIESPEQEARRKARMKADANAYQKQRAKRVATDTCMVLAAVLLAVIGICHQLGV
jgi:predicted house-cleaning NTP pyrophosphatase (Maf/HAM1 superfamily)